MADLSRIGRIFGQGISRLVGSAHAAIDSIKTSSAARKLAKSTSSRYNAQETRALATRLRAYIIGQVKSNALGLPIKSPFTKVVQANRNPPMINSGQLVEHLILEEKTLHVLLKFDNRRINGIPASILARLHENGATVRLTDNARAYFGARFNLYFKKDKHYFTIPARPFFSKAADEFARTNKGTGIRLHRIGMSVFVSVETEQAG